MVAAEGSRLDKVGCTIVARRMVEALSPWLPGAGHVAGARPGPMDYAEAAAFAKGTLGFGAHAATPIGELSADYLEWLADRSRQTWLDLDRFLNSPNVKRERQSTAEPEP